MIVKCKNCKYWSVENFDKHTRYRDTWRECTYCDQMFDSVIIRGDDQSLYLGVQTHPDFYCENGEPKE